MKGRKWLLIGLVVLSLLLALGGLWDHGTAQAQDAMARVRFLHAVPGAPEVDIYLDGALTGAAVAYKEATPHLSVTSGDHVVQVRQAGTENVLVEAPVSLATDLAFSLVIQGVPGTLEVALYEDILDALEPGMARMTAIHAMSDAPAVDILTADGGPLLQGVAYGVQYGTINIPVGPKDLLVVPTGGAPDSALAPIGEVPLVSGTLYTFVIMGTVDGSVPPAVLTVATALNAGPEDVRVRIAHGSPDMPAVDVYVDGTLIAPSLALGQMTAHLPLPAGDHEVILRAAGGAPDAEPIASTSITLDTANPAVTLAVTGETGDSSLAIQTFVDPVSDIDPASARLVVINTIPGASVAASLADVPATVPASAVPAGEQSDAQDVAPGRYMMTVGVAEVDAPVEIFVPEQLYAGGAYYTVLAYGGGAAAVPYDARVAETAINVTAVSLPGAAEAAVVAVEVTPEPTAAEVAEVTPEPTEQEVAAAESATATPTVEATESEVVAAQPDNTELVVDAQPTQDMSSEVVQSTPVPQPAVTQPPSVPTAYLELDPGANLHCREYPSSEARSLGLIPAQTTVKVLGRIGAGVMPETGEPTPEPTPVVETLQDLWLSVQWDTPDGGYLRCWVSAQYLRVEFRGKVLDSLEKLMELPEQPFNQPGEAVNTQVSPPTPPFNAPLATVNLDPGVSLQLRRTPETSGESLDLVPAGAQLEVLGYIEAPGQGMVGQPSDPNWLRVRYRKENGGATIGWVSAQYVQLSQAGREIEITELTLLEEVELGFYEEAGVQPQVPIDQQDVVGIVNLDPGANLNLRDRPSADAFVVRAIPTGQVVTLTGRNGDGTWVRATYEVDGGTLEGWVAVQYLLISQGGQAYDLAKLPHVWDDVDVLIPGQPTPTATETPTPNPA